MTALTIGHVSFPYRGRWATARLDENLCWACDAPEAVPMLTEASGLSGEERFGVSRAVMRRRGRHAMYRLASRMGGSVTLATAESTQLGLRFAEA
ncbi:MAG: hypothetical protein AAF823_15255 [Planctomycetota bacterium]